MKGYRVFCMVLLLAGIIHITVAQEGSLTSEQQGLLALTTKAFKTTTAQDSFAVSGTNNIVQNIVAVTAAGTTTSLQKINQVINGELQLQPTMAASLQLHQIIEVTTNGQAQELDQTAEMILLPDGFYMRFPTTKPLLMGMSFPKEWVNLMENPNAFPGSNVINAEQYLSMIQSQLQYQMDATTVIAIQELPGVTLEDMDLRVIEIQLDFEALMSSEEMRSAMGILNFEQLGLDAEQFLEAMDSDRMLITVWINPEDTRIYRQTTEMDITIQMDNLYPGITSGTLTQFLEQSTTYSRYNETFTIEAPNMNNQ